MLGRGVIEVSEEKLKKTSAILVALQDQSSSAEGILKDDFAVVVALAGTRPNYRRVDSVR